MMHKERALKCLNYLKFQPKTPEHRYKQLEMFPSAPPGDTRQEAFISNKQEKLHKTKLL